MIRCSKCGTLNRDNSRFCNECGAALQRTSVRCPNCGAVNPVVNVFCDKCNTRLAPSTGLTPPPISASPEGAPSGLKSISLPVRSAEVPPESAELPDWLLELSDKSSVSDQTETSVGTGALPDWLAALGEGEPVAAPAPSEPPGSGELPNWLAGLEWEAAPSSPEPVVSPTPDQPTSSAPSSDEPALPDWLSGLAKPATGAAPSSLADWLAEPEETSAEAAPAGQPPDWMAGLMAAEPEPAEESAQPDWLHDLISPEPPAPSVRKPAPPPDLPLTKPTEETALPGWLSDFGLTEPAAEEEAAAEQPDWLSSLVSAEPAAEEEEGSQPDWLRSLAPEPAAAEEPTSAQPDWLSGFGLPEPAAEEEPEGQPDWLTGLVSTEPTEEAAAGPDWLRSMVGEEPAEEPRQSDWRTGLVAAEPVEAEEEEVFELDWAHGITEEEPAETEAPQAGWLSGVGVAEPVEAEEEEVFELDWARGITEEEPVAEEESVSPSLAFAQFTEEEMPEPVSDVGEVAIAPARPLPDWLRAIADPTASQPAARPSEIPSWLLQNADRGVPKMSTGPVPLPNWLLVNAEALPSKPAPPKPSVAAPPEVKPITRTAPAAPAVPAAPAAELPDWMSDMVSEAAPEEEAPAWTAGPAAEPAAELPDWISGMVSEAAPEEEAPAWTAGPAAEPAAELPDWISGMVSEAAPEEETPAWTGAPAAEPAAELPDWLSGMVSETAPEAAEESAAPAWTAAAPAGKLPDWLSGVEMQAEAPVGAEPEKAELPDWLSSITEAEEKEEIPDWLAAAGEEEGTRSAPGTPASAAIFEELPSEVTPMPGQSDGADKAAPPAAVFTEAPETAEIPDWLKAVEPAEPPTTKAPGRLAARRQQGAAPSAEATVPDWLAHISEEEAAVTPAAPAFVPGVLDTGIGKPAAPKPEEAAESAPEESPGWLDELVAPSEEEASDITEIPAGDELARANVPTWLQELRPLGTGPLPALPPEIAGILDKGAPAAAAEPAAGLARAEIPDWVQQLRPTTTGAGEGVSEKYLGPVEESGPLAGLAGLIAPMAAVDIPTDFVPTPLPQVPEAIVQQAQLWQQLLEQPRGKARPVAQQRVRPGFGAALLRIGVALLLFAAGAVGMLWGGESLGQPPDSTARPGLGLLQTSIETLQAGDTVIFAVEYGPAESLEMEPIAETLLDQLAEREVNVMAVSTLPEGPGLIQGLLAGRTLTNQLPITESYRIGADSGIADLLNQEETLQADMVLVVAARLDPMRGWIEQNAAARRPLPLGVATNAANGAYIMPYFETRGLNGWLVGIADLTTYRQMLYQGEFAQLGTLDLARVLNALLLTHWAAAGLLVFGLLYAVAAGKKGAR